MLSYLVMVPIEGLVKYLTFNYYHYYCRFLKIVDSCYLHPTHNHCMVNHDSFWRVSSVSWHEHRLVVVFFYLKSSLVSSCSLKTRIHMWNVNETRNRFPSPFFGFVNYFLEVIIWCLMSHVYFIIQRWRHFITSVTILP